MKSIGQQKKQMTKESPIVKCFIELSIDLDNWFDFRDSWFDYVQKLTEYASIGKAEMVIPASEKPTVIELPRY